MLNRKMLALIGIASFCGSAWLFAQKSTGKALTAQDLVDIQQLYAKYNWTLDSGDAEAYASTFTPDGVFNNNVGHDAIVKFANTFHGGIGAHVRPSDTKLLITPSAQGGRGPPYRVLAGRRAQPVAVGEPAGHLEEAVFARPGVVELLLEQPLDHVAGHREHRHDIPERLNREQVAVRDLAGPCRRYCGVRHDVRANSPRIHERHDGPAAVRGTRRGQLRIGDDVTQGRLACGVGGASEVAGHRADDLVGGSPGERDGLLDDSRERRVRGDVTGHDFVRG